MIVIDDPDEEVRPVGPEPAHRRPAVRFRAALLGALAALLALLTAWLTLGDGLDRWRGDPVLDSACDGLLPVAAARAVLGEGRLAERRDPSSAADGTPADHRCVVAGTGDGGNSVDVAVHRVERGADAVGTPSYPGTDARWPVPLGGGWDGFFNGVTRTEPRSLDALAAVLVLCPRGATDLLVTVRGVVVDGAMDNPVDRLRIARLATGTARASADRFGCGAHPAADPAAIALPSAADEDVAPSDARGACAGVPAPSGTGRAQARVRESGRGVALRERCEVTSVGADYLRYELDAYYGPYAEEVRKRPGAAGDGVLVAAASCAGGAVPGLYVIRSPWSAEEGASPTYPQRALDAFAERSAKARGCTLRPADAPR
ncbi:hypothetical protein ACH4E8_01415 [Streptomyces sp. NPDC017979]|uniref:hypothetical protein n=1 Tax=Streptomyces sp. NPDC017979 TaxID=3365024 RepID=UPI0037A120B7